MEANFKRCLDFVLKHEGGWADDPRDPGGATMRGITIKTYAQWRKKHGRSDPSKDDLKRITLAEITDLYHEEYWLPVKCDKLRVGLDLALFDACVNLGPGTAAKLLQRALGVEDDGVIGKKTIQAAWDMPVLDVVEKFTDLRIEYYMTRPGWKHYGNGWQRRAEEAEIEANNLWVVQ